MTLRARVLILKFAKFMSLNTYGRLKLETKSIGNNAMMYGSLRRRWANLTIVAFQDGGLIIVTVDLSVRTTFSVLTIKKHNGIDIAIMMVKAMYVVSFMEDDADRRFSKNTT